MPFGPVSQHSIRGMLLQANSLTGTKLRIGNVDVISFVEAAMRTTRDATRMARVSGSVTCAGDFTPLVAWKVDFPLSGALNSARMSTLGWVVVGLSIFTFTFM